MTAHFSHPLTNAQRQALHRAKVKLKLARLERYEAALREIADYYPDPFEPVRRTAERALNAEAEA